MVSSRTPRESGGTLRKAVKLGHKGAPAIVSLPEDEAPRSIVIVLPGGGVRFDKRWAEAWLPLEGLPAVKAYVDLPRHGERMAADLRESYRHNRIKGFFAPAILGMADELPSIIDDLLDLAANPSIRKVGVCGWSIGGLAVFLAALREERIGALAGFAIPGGGIHHLRLNEFPGDREGLALLDELDLLPRAHRLYPRPVLLMHGNEDTWVSAESSRALCESLKAVYTDSPEKLRYIEYPGVPHDPCEGSPKQRQAIPEAIRQWFETHLLPSPVSSSIGGGRPQDRAASHVDPALGGQ